MLASGEKKGGQQALLRLRLRRRRRRRRRRPRQHRPRSTEVVVVGPEISSYGVHSFFFLSIQPTLGT